MPLIEEIIAHTAYIEWLNDKNLSHLYLSFESTENGPVHLFLQKNLPSDSITQYRFDMDKKNPESIKMLGQGDNGVVLAATNLATQEAVAIKIVTDLSNTKILENWEFVRKNLSSQPNFIKIFSLGTASIQATLADDPLLEIIDQAGFILNSSQCFCLVSQQLKQGRPNQSFDIETTKIHMEKMHAAMLYMNQLYIKEYDYVGRNVIYDTYTNNFVFIDFDDCDRGDTTGKAISIRAIYQTVLPYSILLNKYNRLHLLGKSNSPLIKVLCQTIDLIDANLDAHPNSDFDEYLQMISPGIISSVILDKLNVVPNIDSPEVHDKIAEKLLTLNINKFNYSFLQKIADCLKGSEHVEQLKENLQNAKIKLFDSPKTVILEANSFIADTQSTISVKHTSNSPAYDSHAPSAAPLPSGLSDVPRCT